jgi:hypothetical protein
MAIKDDIFAGPVDIPALLKKQSEASLVDSLFINFIYYAKHNWTYIASASAGGEALLDGSATQVPCGGIATALKILIEEKLHQKVDYITIPGYVWTNPTFLCFDPKVMGNVSRAETPNSYTEGCFFNEHYFIECNGKFYDPCLNSTYTTKYEAIRKSYNVADTIARGEVMKSDNPNSLLVFRKDVVVPGWQRGAWLIVRADQVLKYVTDKFVLKSISTKLKYGPLAEAARKASRKQFAEAGKLEQWQKDHISAGIQV